MFSNITPTFNVYYPSNITLHDKIAGFDLDWTLVRPNKGKFPKDENDIVWLPNRKQTLQWLHENNYTIVIITNQNVNKNNPLHRIMGRLNIFVSIVNLPIIIMVSLSKDNFRKPNIGSINYLRNIYNHNNVNINIEESFYVGDAAGRPLDFSDSDLQFARNAHIKFYTDTEFFQPVRPILPDTKSLVIMVGCPGSGKSTYVNTYLTPLGYVHVSRDELGTVPRVRRMTEDNLRLNNNVVIDATNGKLEQRIEYYNLARRYNYIPTLIWLVRDGEIGNKLRINSVPIVAIRTYYKYLELPTDDEILVYGGHMYEIY